MLLRLQNYFTNIRPVTVDGTLYVLIALFGYMQATMSSEEAYKYASPHLLYWSKFSVGALLAVVSALKMFRSTSYSEHLAGKETPAPAKEPTKP